MKHLNKPAYHDELQIGGLTMENTPTNGALSDASLSVLLAKCSTDLYRCVCNENNGIFLAREVDAAIAVLAKRHVAYTVEQTKGHRSAPDWHAGVDGEEIIAILSPPPAPRPKTPEERVTVVAGTEGGYFTLYKIDGKIVQDAEVVKALVSALKESEAHNG